MGFYVTTENPNVMMMENHNIQSSEYIIICQDGLYIVSVEKLQFSLLLISCCQGILNASWLSWCLVLKIACLHVFFTAYENFYKLSKMHCLLVLTFHFPIIRISEYRNPTIKYISNYTLVSSSIGTYVSDLFLGSISHSKTPSECQGLIQV